MKRFAILLLAATLLSLSLTAALAETGDGWVLVKVDAKVYAQPKAEGPAVFEAPKGRELEYLGVTKYDEDKNAWYGVSFKGEKGWIDSHSAELKWSTLY